MRQESQYCFDVMRAETKKTSAAQQISNYSSIFAELWKFWLVSALTNLFVWSEENHHLCCFFSEFCQKST